jgi:ATP-dependent helicase/nuclease subunit A
MVAHMEQVAATLPDTPGNDKLIPKYRTIPRMFRQAKPGSRVPELMEIFAAFDKTTVVQKMWPGKGSQAKEELERYDAFRTTVAEPLVKAWREYRYEPLLRALRPAQKVYDELRAGAGKLNFQDLLMKAAGLLRTRPSVRRYFRRRFTHLLVDEFQDTDPVQAEVMMLLTADDPEETDWRRCCPAPGSLFVVGDPKQSIYRFRRADIVTYNQVKEIVRRTGGLVVNLTTNFRTVKPLIEWVNRTFAERFPEHPAECSPDYVPLQPFRDDQDASAQEGPQVLRIDRELSKNDELGEYEADLIARAIRNAVDSGLHLPRAEKESATGVSPQARYGDFLIITPRTANLSRYGRKLREYGIPHQVTGGSAMNQVDELTLLHTCLSALTEPENPVALVAVLRSEIFGFSDEELFRFVRAGGRFDFHAAIPETLDAPTTGPFRESYARLQQYAQWVSQLPHVAAIEKIAADLGLVARAAASPGGDVQAGSFAKALELLRVAQKEVSTLGELVDRLGSLVQEEETYDAIPARPGRESMVRVMNLHKVKGLEAPIIFLADPTGKTDHSPLLHVDRSGETVRGYLPVYGTVAGRSELLAQPEKWDVFSGKEKQFQAAEELRLLYVAATRAGARLVVTQRESKQGMNPWAFFSYRLEQAPVLADPGPPSPMKGATFSPGDLDFQTADSAIRRRWELVSAKTYEVSSVKALAVQRGKFTYSQGEHGVEWGTVIHLLLEAAMKNPGADIHQLARAALADQGLETMLAAQAVETVQSVIQSEIWQRALAATKRLVEVPFQRLIPNDPASTRLTTVLRGVIDLTFLEPQGWVIVDYKSDRVPDGRIPDLVELYTAQVIGYAEAWSEFTAEQVHEVGLLFTHHQVYVTVPFHKQ